MKANRRIKRKQEQIAGKAIKRSKRKGLTRVNALDIYSRKREVNDIDLVAQIEMSLSTLVNKESASLFINDPSIKDVKDKTPEVQRIIINKFFTGTLMMFRSMKNIPVFEQSNLMVMDGDNKDWLKIFNMVIVPFIKANNVLPTIYKQLTE